MTKWNFWLTKSIFDWRNRSLIATSTPHTDLVSSAQTCDMSLWCVQIIKRPVHFLSDNCLWNSSTLRPWHQLHTLYRIFIPDASTDSRKLNDLFLFSIFKKKHFRRGKGNRCTYFFTDRFCWFFICWRQKCLTCWGHKC